MRKDADVELMKAPADDTITGATSGDVHTGLGHPGVGQTSAEIRHDGEKSRKNPGRGLQGAGSGTQELQTVDTDDRKHSSRINPGSNQDIC